MSDDSYAGRMGLCGPSPPRPRGPGRFPGGPAPRPGPRSAPRRTISLCRPPASPAAGASRVGRILGSPRAEGPRDPREGAGRLPTHTAPQLPLSGGDLTSQPVQTVSPCSWCLPSWLGQRPRRRKSVGLPAGRPSASRPDRRPAPPLPRRPRDLGPGCGAGATPGSGQPSPAGRSGSPLPPISPPVLPPTPIGRVRSTAPGLGPRSREAKFTRTLRSQSSRTQPKRPVTSRFPWFTKHCFGALPQRLGQTPAAGHEPKSSPIKRFTGKGCLQT